MRKGELLKENEQLKKDLADVCEHHTRLTKLLNQKIDEIAELKNHKQKLKSSVLQPKVKNEKKIKSERKRSVRNDC